MNFSIPATSVKIITLVVCAIALGTLVCLFTLAGCMVFHITVEQGLLTAFVGLTGQFVGSLTTMLSNTRSSPGTNGDMPKIVADKPTP